MLADAARVADLDEGTDENSDVIHKKLETPEDIKNFISKMM